MSLDDDNCGWYDDNGEGWPCEEEYYESYADSASWDGKKPPREVYSQYYGKVGWYPCGCGKGKIEVYRELLYYCGEIEKICCKDCRNKIEKLHDEIMGDDENYHGFDAREAFTEDKKSKLLDFPTFLVKNYSSEYLQKTIDGLSKKRAFAKERINKLKEIARKRGEPGRNKAVINSIQKALDIYDTIYDSDDKRKEGWRRDLAERKAHELLKKKKLMTHPKYQEYKDAIDFVFKESSKMIEYTEEEIMADEERKRQNRIKDRKRRQALKALKEKASAYLN